jgi:hypothetical protein
MVNALPAGCQTRENAIQQRRDILEEEPKHRCSDLLLQVYLDCLFKNGQRQRVEQQHLGETVHDRAAQLTGPQLPPIIPGSKSLTAFLIRVSASALEKLRKFEYVPLWYFTEQGYRAADEGRSGDDDLLVLTGTEDNSLALRPANRPSPDALEDHQLTWEQFVDCKTHFLRWLLPSNWPLDYCKLLATFFFRIANHDLEGISGGKDTLLLYQARMRRTWHEELKVGHCFDISEIDEKFLERCHREVMAAQSNAALASLASVLHSSPALEVGPTTPSQSGRPRSQKSNRIDSMRPRQQRHHPYQRGSPGPSGAQDQAQGLCIVCLREPHQNMAECRRDILGDGKPACSYRNGRGDLVDKNGKAVCADFQRPEGCAGGCRTPRHRCSGCGKSQHGAADCPRRANAYKDIEALMEDLV